ncbi:uncharacterized protein LOC132314393 [Cornus florida]|uniref:uncharacterized protein LOC132314393 n=1 Tax=Cornus florida TaxID=4283 RepID=UPI00289E9E91|nr:uncharacterized protein LOC132314393 [Cornus florida]
MEEDNFKWVFTGVYGPVVDDERPIFWEELCYVQGLWSFPWCLGGDLNSVRSSSERSTGGRSLEMDQFSDFINEYLLVDLPIEGATYTWSNGRDPITLSRLDKILISGDWEDKFPDVVQAMLERVTSDHVHLVLDCGGLCSQTFPFRFENMWLRSDDFQGKVSSWWEGVTSLEIDRLEEARRDMESLHSRRASCRAVFAEIASMEEISWQQKSRALWLKEGDRNTKFFHQLANAHRRSNHIGRIRVDGEELWREEEVHNGVASFYQKLYTESLVWRPKLDGLHFEAISELDKDRIENPFTEEEVLKALSSCNGDKALGPDGFTMRFLMES